MVVASNELASFSRGALSVALSAPALVPADLAPAFRRTELALDEATYPLAAGRLPVTGADPAAAFAFADCA